MLANLFGGGHGTAANSRVKRAQQLRQQRMAAAAAAANSATASTAPKIQSNKKTDEEEEVLVVSGMCTILCALAIIALGAAMATVFFLVHKPDCIRGISSSSVAAGASQPAGSGVRRMKEMGAAIPEEELVNVDADAKYITTTTESAAAAAAVANASPLRGSSNSGGTASKEAVAGAFAEELFPPQCSSDQMIRLAEQLPAGGCERNKDKAWRRTSCSFSLATSCSDGAWFKKYYAENPPVNGPLTAVIVGCNKGYQAMEMLALGTQASVNYDWKTWQYEFTKEAPFPVSDNPDSCPRAGTKSETKNRAVDDSGADVYCIEPVNKTFQRLVATKMKFGIGDQLHLDQLVISDVQNKILVHNGDKIGVEGAGISNWQIACPPDKTNDCSEVPVDTLDHYLSTRPELKDDSPIHFVSLGLEGYDYLALVGAAKSFKRIHYMELQYHWFGNWGSNSLKDMVLRMKRKNFACYFAGDNKLWRLTDCFQEHYEHRFYANIACVNLQMAPGLAAEMENIFQQTLQQQLTFGEK